MKTRNILSTVAGCLALGTFHGAFAQELIVGTVSGGTPAIVIPANANNVAQGLSGLLKFKFTAVKAGAYDITFCIGPASNPCGLATSIVYEVAGGTAVFALINASVFDHGNVLAAAVGTASPVEYEVSLE